MLKTKNAVNERLGALGTWIFLGIVCTTGILLPQTDRTATLEPMYTSFFYSPLFSRGPLPGSIPHHRRRRRFPLRRNAGRYTADYGGPLLSSSTNAITATYAGARPTDICHTSAACGPLRGRTLVGGRASRCCSRRRFAVDRLRRLELERASQRHGGGCLWPTAATSGKRKCSA
jgi:hypothetical protein